MRFPIAKQQKATIPVDGNSVPLASCGQQSPFPSAVLISQLLAVTMSQAGTLTVWKRPDVPFQGIL
jgi:hypothetical protein